jgi:hypothetical protein
MGQPVSPQRTNAASRLVTYPLYAGTSMFGLVFQFDIILKTYRVNSDVCSEYIGFVLFDGAFAM